MSQEIIAFVGISGVGKSTLLRRISETFHFQHLQASALIRAARSATTPTPVSGDALRLADIDENQKLLVEGFGQARDKRAALVVLDGHTVIDTPAGLHRIAPEVFAAIGVTQFVFLADDPIKINERRSLDSGQKRPARTAIELEEHQHIGLLNTLKASLALSVPIVVITPSQTDAVHGLFAVRSRSASR